MVTRRWRRRARLGAPCPSSRTPTPIARPCEVRLADAQRARLRLRRLQGGRSCFATTAASADTVLDAFLRLVLVALRRAARESSPQSSTPPSPPAERGAASPRAPAAARASLRRSASLGVRPRRERRRPRVARSRERGRARGRAANAAPSPPLLQERPPHQAPLVSGVCTNHPRGEPVVSTRGSCRRERPSTARSRIGAVVSPSTARSRRTNIPLRRAAEPGGEILHVDVLGVVGGVGVVCGRRTANRRDRRRRPRPTAFSRSRSGAAETSPAGGGESSREPRVPIDRSSAVEAGAPRGRSRAGHAPRRS